MRLCMLRAHARDVSAVVCVGSPLRARLTHEITHLDGRAVGLYIYYKYRNMLISIKILIMKIIMKLNKQMSFLYNIYIYDYVRGRATPGPYSARDGAFGWASGVARPRAARAI